jgi:hypothetical protein
MPEQYKNFGAFLAQSFGGFFPPITKDFLSYWRYNGTLRHTFKLLLNKINNN